MYGKYWGIKIVQQQNESMKNMLTVFGMVSLLASTCLCAGRPVDPHKELLERLFAIDEDIRLEQYANRRFYDVVFFDMNHDGKDEALVGHGILHDNDGIEWKLASDDGNGGIRFTGLGNWNGISVTCWALNLYHAKFNGNIGALVGKRVMVNEMFNAGRDNMFERFGVEDVILTMRSNGEMSRTVLRGGIDDIVGNPGFRSLSRACVKTYHADKKGILWDKAPVSTDGNSLMANLPELPEPIGFDVFVRNYRGELKRLHGNSSGEVYVVFLDVDNDGDADFYVSSNVESLGDGNNRWQLYLNSNGKYEKAESTIWYNREKRDLVNALEPVEICGRNDFYRLQGSGMNPAFVILTKDGGRLSSAAYRRHVSAKDRQRRPLEGVNRRDGKMTVDDWRFEVNGILGFTAPGDFNDLISNSSFISLERLPCKVFPL